MADKFLIHNVIHKVLWCKTTTALCVRCWGIIAEDYMKMYLQANRTASTHIGMEISLNLPAMAWVIT